MAQRPSTRRQAPQRRMLLIGGGAALAAILAGLASGIATSSSAGAAGTLERPTIVSKALAQMTTKVFFVRGQRFVPRKRVVESGEPGELMAIRALLAGPTTAERNSGINTTIPRGTSLVSLSVRHGLATIALRSTANRTTLSEVSARPARAAQIVYTLVASTKADKLLIKMNGRPWATFGGSKLRFKDARGRSDLTKSIRLPSNPSLVPKGPAPAAARGVQKRLVNLRYLPAKAVTGKWDGRTFHAVTAFQAWQGLSRDGIVGPQTLAALETAAQPKPARSASGRHVEVYRTKGVTLLLDRGRVIRAIHSSSGAKGYETPTGSYPIFRKERRSWSVPYKEWLPHASYFNRGIAFHGYPSVPAWPASHGCVRLPAVEAPFAYDFMQIGTSVSVY